MVIYLKVSINCLGNINYNYVISFNYLDNLPKRMRNQKLTKRNFENIMHNLTIIRIIWTTSKKNNINKI